MWFMYLDKSHILLAPTSNILISDSRPNLLFTPFDVGGVSTSTLSESKQRQTIVWETALNIHM